MGKKGSTLVFMMLVSLTLAYSGRSYAQIQPELLPLHEHVLYIDRDGDGYGIAAPNGPDADDADPSVNTYESAISKYGTLQDLLEHLGYFPRRIFDQETRPEVLQPGDLILYKAGEYTGKYPLGLKKVHGTAADPIILLGMPGERTVVRASHVAINIWESSHVVLDGFELDGTYGEAGSKGMSIHFSQHLTVKNIYSHHHGSGIRGFQDLHNILIENCVVGDHNDTHGIYLGSRDYPNTDLTVRGCRMYRNERHGFQHNGRVTNLILEGNISHSNDLGGISLIEGVSQSFVRNNLIFNNNKQGIIFYGYDDSVSEIVPYNQDHNVVENNIIWGGVHSWNGKNNPTFYGAIEFNDGTESQEVRMDHTIIRNNILVTHSPVVLRFRQQKLFDTAMITGNIIYSPKSLQSEIVEVAGTRYGLNTLPQELSQIRENRFQEVTFQDVNVEYYTTPERFDFTISVAKKEKPEFSNESKD